MASFVISFLSFTYMFSANGSPVALIGMGRHSGTNRPKAGSVKRPRTVVLNVVF